MQCGSEWKCCPQTCTTGVKIRKCCQTCSTCIKHSCTLQIITQAFAIPILHIQLICCNYIMPISPSLPYCICPVCKDVRLDSFAMPACSKGVIHQAFFQRYLLLLSSRTVPNSIYQTVPLIPPLSQPDMYPTSDGT